MWGMTRDIDVAESSRGNMTQEAGRKACDPEDEALR